MYNVQRIIDFKKSVQSDIDLLLRAKRVQLLKIVEQELPVGHKIWLNMGTCVAEDEKGKGVDNDFIEELTGLNYTDAFESGFDGFSLPMTHNKDVVAFKEVDHCWFVSESCQYCLRDNNSLYLKPEDREETWEICDEVGDSINNEKYKNKYKAIDVLSTILNKPVIILE